MLQGFLQDFDSLLKLCLLFAFVGFACNHPLKVSYTLLESPCFSEFLSYLAVLGVSTSVFLTVHNRHLVKLFSSSLEFVLSLRSRLFRLLRFFLCLNKLVSESLQLLFSFKQSLGILGIAFGFKPCDFCLCLSVLLADSCELRLDLLKLALTLTLLVSELHRIVK